MIECRYGVVEFQFISIDSKQTFKEHRTRSEWLKLKLKLSPTTNALLMPSPQLLKNFPISHLPNIPAIADSQALIEAIGQLRAEITQLTTIQADFTALQSDVTALRSDVTANHTNITAQLKAR